jgi:2-methylfumaryl-CoA isomerase
VNTSSEPAMVEKSAPGPTCDSASDAVSRAAPTPLTGLRIVEISSFVAVPLAGMTLAQLGAEVVRVDPIEGAADYRRWPVIDAGDSIYWAGLNKGKRSVLRICGPPKGKSWSRD